MWPALGRLCGLGMLFSVLTSPSFEDILTKHRHPSQNSILENLPTDEDNSREVLRELAILCFLFQLGH